MTTTTQPQAASDLRRAYDAGFSDSGEGWNGEYPPGPFTGASLEHYEKTRDATLAVLARPAPDATPAGADIEALRKVAKWIEQRMDAAEGDRDAHPKDHALNRFYGGQAIAYENALSLVLNTARELKTVLAPPASAADGEEPGEAKLRHRIIQIMLDEIAGDEERSPVPVYGIDEAADRIMTAIGESR